MLPFIKHAPLAIDFLVVIQREVNIHNPNHCIGSFYTIARNAIKRQAEPINELSLAENKHIAKLINPSLG